MDGDRPIPVGSTRDHPFSTLAEQGELVLGFQRHSLLVRVVLAYARQCLVFAFDLSAHFTEGILRCESSVWIGEVLFTALIEGTKTRRRKMATKKQNKKIDRNIPSTSTATVTFPPTIQGLVQTCSVALQKGIRCETMECISAPPSGSTSPLSPSGSSWSAR